MSRWETHRGDDWSYSDAWCDADASANSATRSFFIETIRPKGAQLTHRCLHGLLWLTQEQLPDLRIRLSLKPETRALLEELVAEGLLTWRLFENPHSQEAWLLSIAHPISHRER
jgi:hypothetical protein